MPSRVNLADCVVIFLLAALLIAPLFRIEYLDNWGSIESTFIADARFLIEHWPHPLWQPLWYCGTRFDYIYPPALRYGTAAIAMLFDVSTARAYHVYTALLYCIGFVALYVLVRTVAGSRIWAAVAASAAAVLSPSFLILPAMRADAVLHMPQRLNVLVQWGEGPHVSALALLPFALLFSWRALSARTLVSLVLAALSCALLVAHNFYGAAALAIFFSMLVFSVWIAHGDPGILWRAFWIVMLSCGLSAFWLTPSYVRITIENLKLVAQPGNAWSLWIALATAIVFAMSAWKLAHGRKDRAYGVVVSGAVLFFGLIVIGHQYLGLRIAGEPHRLAPELDLALILGAVEVLRLMGRHKWRRVVAAAVAVVALAASYRYVSHPWSVFAADANFRNRIEYRMSEWISSNLPEGRTFAAGSLRLWYDAWHDAAQVGGGSEQGLLNGTLALAQWQVTRDAITGRDIAWLQAVGADAVAVAEPRSSALLPEFDAPRKFAGVLPVLYDDAEGNVLYRVPRRFGAHARIVRSRDAERLRPIPISNDAGPHIQAYAMLLEKGPDRPVEMKREAPEIIVLRARLEEGDSLLVQESYDAAWRAYCNGRQVPIRKDVAGFMQVYAPPGDREVRLVFELPLENKIGRIVTGAAVMLAALVLLRRRMALRLIGCTL